MKNKRNLALVVAITLAGMPLQSQAAWFDDLSNTSVEQRVKGGLVIAAVAAFGYGIYRHFRAASNETLREQARAVYDRVHRKYRSLKFVKYPNRMKISQTGYLFQLAGHRDLALVRRVGNDLPQLKQHISLLSKRITKDSGKGKTDGAMQSLYTQMRSLADKLEHVNKFWNTHASFFAMHEYLSELSGKYSKYDYNNPQAVRMQVRGDAAGERGDAYTYPFKTFTTDLASHITSLHGRIHNLRTKAQSFADREVIANEYYNMLSQADPFYHALVYLRDVAANQPEYAVEMQQYEQAEQKRAELAAQERAAAARAQAEREKANAEREKAEAIRYKARMDYLAKMQKQPQQTNVTVVNQTAAAGSEQDGSRTDNNNA